MPQTEEDRLKQTLRNLEVKTSVLEVPQADRDQMTNKAMEMMNMFDDSTRKLTWGPVKTSDPGCRKVVGEIKETPTEYELVMQDFNDHLVNAGMNLSHPTCFGLIPTGGGTYPAALGAFIPATLASYSGFPRKVTTIVEMENKLIEWVAGLFGYPAGHAGNITSGASLSSLTAMAVARDSMGLKAADFHRCVVYCSEFTHYSVLRGLRAVGLREAVLRTIPLDQLFKMTTTALEKQIKEDKEAGLVPFLVVATVGTTLTGTVDPLNDIADVCERHQLWLHVDAAYGGFFALCDEMKPLFAGVERSDSILVNPHKGLFTPVGVSVLVVKDGKKLQQCCSMEQTPSCFAECQLFSDEHVSPSELSFEISRPFRGAQMWLPLNVFGVGVFRTALQEKLLLTRYFYGKLKETGDFELPLEPELSVVVFRATAPPGVDINDFNQQLLEGLNSDGKIFMTPAVLSNQFYLRVCVLAFRTHVEHVDLCFSVIQEKRLRLRESLRSEA
ncbi:DDC [Branchiostoma lanceolatum]|nr:DDC [Branchiostoma lanceolatum]